MVDGLTSSQSSEVEKDPRGLYLVFFEDPPLVTFQRRAAGGDKLRLFSAASAAYREFLLEQQAGQMVALERMLGRTVAPAHRYTVAANGVAIRVSPAEASRVARLEGVVQVMPDNHRMPLTDAGPSWIGAPDVWDGSAIGTVAGTQGEGIIIGIIDTGINLSHPSFADIGHDGYDHTNPWGAGNYTGFCQADPANYRCNDKLIGVWAWPDTGNDPHDDYGHGSNVAGIAAGNVVTLSYGAPTTRLTATLSGVAPHANLIAYDVCQLGLGCPDSVTLAAIDQALLDGVDVLNFSIGGGPMDPWQDPVARAFLVAREAGVFVVTSAGNNGPRNNSINSPANAPWMLTVANSTHHARFDNPLLDLSGGMTPPPGDLVGSSITAAYGPAPIVWAGNYTNSVGQDDGKCSASFPAGTWNHGEIVFCRRGGQSSHQKALNVAAGGAGGVVVGSSTQLGQRLGINRLVLPGLNLLLQDGDAVQSWLQSGGVHTATIGGTTRVFEASYGDEIYVQSSRGPTPFVLDVLKPNLSAPGTKIWSASKASAAPDPPLSIYSGTSQSSPHVAGAGALLRALFPLWSVAEIESALMSTAVTATMRLEDGTTAAGPFDMGAGRVDVGLAARAGLVMDEQTANFRAADPALGGDPTQLNGPSLVHGNCVQTCSWRRELKNPTGTTGTWGVSHTLSPSLTLSVVPSQFNLAPGASQIITVTADITGVVVGEWVFGELVLREATGLAPVAHFPLAVRSSGLRMPHALQVDTRHDSGSTLLSGLAGTGIHTLTVTSYGLVTPEIVTASLAQDPTRAEPYGNLNDGADFAITVTVPSEAKRLVALPVTSEAEELALFVGKDDGDGIPEQSEELCAATAAGWQPKCDLLDPAAGAYWILVRNWSGPAASPNEISLATAVITGAVSSNSHVSGPLGKTVSSAFDLRYFWQFASLNEGDLRMGLLEIGRTPSTPNDLAQIPVNLVRHGNPVMVAVTPATVTVGAPATFTITLAHNVTTQELGYGIAVTIPQGLRYLPGTASHGAIVNGNSLNWTIVQPKLGAEGDTITYMAAVDGSVCRGVVTNRLVALSDNAGSTPLHLNNGTAIRCQRSFLPLIHRP
jgi:subtilisin family serine protease